LLASFKAAGSAPMWASLVAFAVISAGGIGSLVAGKLADNFGRTTLTIASLVMSGSYALIGGFFFGGVGLYHRKLFFGILFNNNFYLKVDDTNRREYEKEGMPAFKPYKDRPATMQYYEVPAEVLENKEQLKIWAQQAIEVAARAIKSKG
jgi:DNA transformation protein